MDKPHCVNSSTNQLLVISTFGLLNCSQWTFVYKFWVGICFHFSWAGRSQVAGLYGKLMFTILRNCQTVFQSGFFILHSYQQHMNDLVSPHLCQHLVLSLFYTHFWLEEEINLLCSKMLIWGRTLTVENRDTYPSYGLWGLRQ